jgi:hypothetical protein
LDETLPGYGNVTCVIQEGNDVGICRNPKAGPGPGGACNPQGNVCHYQNYSCDISSMRNDCCNGQGADKGCELDPLGIPRCNGLGTCRKAGETCASTADCCEDRPCVPDDQGQLRCGSNVCQKTGESCTINGDCCPGETCLVPSGSTVGTCGGGDTGSGGTGGTGGSAGSAGTSGSSGSNTGGSGGTGGSTGGTGGTSNSCSLYGQTCKVTGDCCNGIPCTMGICKYTTG